jgi:rhodanese-related sulfurtransferase
MAVMPMRMPTNRSRIDVRAHPILIPGAKWIPYSTLAENFEAVSLDKAIVAYCDCPHDEASVEIAQRLRRAGASQVRPLLKGLDGWTAKGFETADLHFTASA